MGAGTIGNTIGTLSQMFRLNFRQSPAHDKHGKMFALLSAQIKGYKGLDPPAKQQAAASLRLLLKMDKIKITPVDSIVSDLVLFAFFFAMRSCEYSSVQGPRKTKTVCLKDVQFYSEKLKTVMHFDAKNITGADSVSVTFRDQKNGKKMDTRTVWKSGHPRACAVLTATSLIKRISQFPHLLEENTLLCTIPSNASPKLVTATMIRRRMQSAASLIGAAELGYKPKDYGTHSIRSGAAMALTLSGYPAFRVMLVGRWSSDAFLKYIREQVAQFSRGVSRKMTENKDFRNVTDIDRNSKAMNNLTNPRNPFATAACDVLAVSNGDSTMAGSGFLTTI